ncbi:hypothetical protein SAY86_004891 [Trapa natans]|uniref:At4g15545-like C-terminal domain-containing protein n=1 Tax=Trapa natans TaxID=22666 RepID=A0AAN7MGC5_TRANT|nr:hypothetical protein SAY86_004891 [Trapa natans]
MSDRSTGVGADFDLPVQILTVIPHRPLPPRPDTNSDPPPTPTNLLDLARKITSMAISSRVSKLESDASHMRQKLYEKERVLDLEEKVLCLERSHQEADSRLKTVIDENKGKEKPYPLNSILTFYSQLINQIALSSLPLDNVLFLTVQCLIGEGANGCGSHQSSGATDIGNSMDENSQHAVQKYSITPYITPRLTPTGTPKIISTEGSPRKSSSVEFPRRTSGVISPIKSHYNSGNLISSWYPSSQPPSATNSPPRGSSMPVSSAHTRIDGKEFFRQARTRLSYEQFSAFLANVKELNAQKQTREETLRKAEEIFGTENKDLFLSFQGLLNRNVY